MFTQKKVSKKLWPASRLDFIKLYVHFFISSNKKVSKKYFCIFKELSTGATFGCREKGSSIIKMSRKISPLSSRLLTPHFSYTNAKRAPYKIITISYETLFFETFLYFFSKLFYKVRNFFISKQIYVHSKKSLEKTLTCL